MQSNTDSLSSSFGVRKRLLPREDEHPAAFAGEIDIASRAVLAYTSDDPDHPIDNLIDGHCGRDSTFWAGAKSDTMERIIVEFDRLQSASWMAFEVEERACARTQEVSVEVSSDGGCTYRQTLVLEYTFSPAGAIFRREVQLLNLPSISHFRLTIVPDKHGSGPAKLNSRRLFASEWRSDT